jgi:tetratricopeptide (TPR) repeat protein
MNGEDPGGRAREVNALRRRFELERAETAANEAVECFPGSAELRLARGKVLVAARNMDGALAEFVRAAELAPGDDRPVGWQVGTLSRSYDHVGAIERGRSALERFPHGAILRVALGRVRLEWSRPAKAVEHFREAARLAPGDETALSWLAAGLAAQFKWSQAEEAVREGLARHRDSVKLLYRRGRILADDHRNKEALECFDSVLDLEPDHVRAMEWRVTALRALGRLDEAENKALEAISWCPKSPWLRVELGWVYCDKGRYEEALENAERAVELGGAPSPWALRTKVDFLRMARRLDEAETAAEQALLVAPRDPRILTAAAVVYADQANVHNDKKKYRLALEKTDQVLSNDQFNSWALRNRIEFPRLAYRMEEAAGAAAAALDARSDDPRVHTTAAWVSSSMGDYDEALDRVSKALAIDKTHSWSLCSRIDFLRQAHRFDEARRAVDQALAERPRDAEVCLAAAWVYSAQDLDDKAAGWAAEALKRDPGNVAALVAQIYLLRWAGHLDDAERAADQALRLRSGDPDILVAVGWVHSDQGRKKDALGFARRALDLDPGNQWALNCRVNFHRAAGDFGAAEEAVREALNARPDDPFVHTVAGSLYGERDEHEKALAHFGKALEVYPWLPHAMEGRIATLRGMLRLDDALAAGEAAVAGRPDDPAIRVELGRVCDLRLEFGKALGHYAKILARDPGNVAAVIARSTALRALRGYEQAEREVTGLLAEVPASRALRTELGWIKYDRRLVGDARQVFRTLLESARNDEETAAARYCLGWADFAEGSYRSAENQFREAVRAWGEDRNYRLALAWAMQTSPESREKARQAACAVAESRPDPFAHACLGVIAYKNGSPGEAEYHLRKTLELDPYQGSYTDLGALYAQVGRYGEAEDILNDAITRDWYDAAAHEELACLYLQQGNDRAADAVREFRQALVLNASSVRAAIGLCEALVKTGNDAGAESVIRDALDRPGPGLSAGDARWRLHDALAWLLMRQADSQDNPGLLDDAYQAAVLAISRASGNPDAYLVAGLVQFRKATLAKDPRTRIPSLAQARKHMNSAIRQDGSHADARRYLDLIKREKRVPAALYGPIAVAVLSVLLLAGLLAMFLRGKISATEYTVNVPVFAGLFTISTLLPTVIRLKMPGFEAELQPQPRQEPRGPTGEELIGPGRFTVAGGPTGQIPRRGQARLQIAKSTKHA